VTAGDGRGTSGTVADGLDAVRRRLVESLPDGVKRRLVGPYNRYLTLRADREFRKRRTERLDRTPGRDAPRHVVCVVVDALRADAIAAADSPFLTAYSRRTLLAPAPWTFPSVSSLVTGQYPHEHGAIRRSDDADTGATDLVVPPALPAETETLPEAFASAGYDTYGGFAFHMPFFAIGGRFARHAVYDGADAEAVLDDFRRWADARADGRTFSYLHLADLHEPVDPPTPYWTRYDVDASIPEITSWDYAADPDPDGAGRRYRRHRKRLYRAALAYVDDQLARLHADLSRRLDGDVLFVVTADHGEAFWEHAAFDAARFADSRPAYCVDHGGTPYESLVRVPLAVDGIGFDASPADDEGRASLVDLAPTLLDAAGLAEDFPATGASLRDAVPRSRVPIVESTRYGHEKKAAYAGEWKLVASKGDGERAGFRLPEEEPAELPPGVESRLAESLPPFPDGESADARVSGMARQRLEDLGYV
jgi:hypothetical protein